MIKFIVRQFNGSEKEFANVHDTFEIGHAHTQDAAVHTTNAVYPVALFEDETGRRYGPILRP